MIAASMLYTVATTLMLYAAGRGAEFIARALRIPTRFVWVICAIAALCLSSRSFVNGRTAQTGAKSIALVSAGAAPPARAAIEAGGHRANDRVPNRIPHEPAAIRAIQSWLHAASTTSHRVLDLPSQIDVVALERWNGALVALWITASLAGACYLLLSFVSLRRIERQLRPESIHGQSVLVSSDVGPALLGVLHSRIVVPAWLLTRPAYEREVVLTHEREHVRAFDPALLYGAALAMLLQPWNVGLWAIFAQLRLAVESDCDRRVLNTIGDARTYGQLLVAVYERSMPGPAASVAFVRRPSNLEKRILRMTRAPRLFSASGVAAILAALVLATTAWTTPSPRHRSSPANAVTSMRPCIVGGRLAGPVAADSLRPMSNGCTIDGDIVVVTLDSSRVLVAAHEGPDAAPQAVDFLVFTVVDQSAPAGLGWRARTHAEYRDGVFYIASPSANIPAMTFGASMAASASDSSALHLLVDQMDILRRPQLTWDVLRKLPETPRCLANFQSDRQSVTARGDRTNPIIYVDGVRISADDCFLIGGYPMRIP